MAPDLPHLYPCSPLWGRKSIARLSTQAGPGDSRASIVCCKRTDITTQRNVPVQERKERGVPEQSTVLVVDDEVGPRESLRAVLKPDYQVLVAAEGEQAIRVVEQEPVDVVLLDLRMPGLSGIRVMEKIKAIDPSIEVILVTGYASYETVLEALRLHAFDYVPKPFNVPHLREMVKRAATHRHSQGWLQQSSKEDELRAHNGALKQRIIELTAALTAANTEMAVFRDSRYQRRPGL
ncbi:MAG: response regulator [Deltaproteobacteria bacterium]|nr:MAG: response regulator [Deltaproteobacteria bacterium]